MTSQAKKKGNYATWLKRQPLSSATKRAYISRIKRFSAFLDASGEVLEELIGKEGERELAFVLKNYKRQLKQKERLSPATVNAHLTAIDHYLQYLGASLPEIPREYLPQEAPRALDKDEQKLFLRSVAACRRSKDRDTSVSPFQTQPMRTPQDTGNTGAGGGTGNAGTGSGTGLEVAREIPELKAVREMPELEVGLSSNPVQTIGNRKA